MLHYMVCNTFTPQVKRILILSATNLMYVAHVASFVECSNELSTHLAVQHLDVALPRLLTTC